MRIHSIALLFVFALALFASCAAPDEPAPLFINATTDNAALDLGLARVRAGDEAGAIEPFTKAIASDPNSAAAYRWRGHCFTVTGDFERALGDYDRAIELEPNYAWAHYARGMANHNLKRFDAAIAGYTRAIQLDPIFLKAWNWRGFTRRLVGDYEGAAGDFEHSVKVAPNDPWTQFELAKTRQALGEYEACERALARAIELEPENASVRAQLGFLLAVRGSNARSIAELEVVVARRAPEEAYARIWIWMQRAERGPAELELRAWFDESRIDDIWQQQLVSFLLGEGNDELMLERATAQTRARVEAGHEPDFLECEAAFYAALRHEVRGELELARGLYEKARARPAALAWEWHMAGVRARALAH